MTCSSSCRGWTSFSTSCSRSWRSWTGSSIPRPRGSPYRDALLWLVYPLIWVGLTLIRGAGDGWYPYPFLDPANGGYGTVAVTVVAVIVAFLVLAVVYIWLGNWRSGGQEPQRAL